MGCVVGASGFLPRLNFLWFLGGWGSPSRFACLVWSVQTTRVCGWTPRLCYLTVCSGLATAGPKRQAQSQPIGVRGSIWCSHIVTSAKSFQCSLKKTSLFKLLQLTVVETCRYLSQRDGGFWSLNTPLHFWVHYYPLALLTKITVVLYDW